jgi:hypothetical protein
VPFGLPLRFIRGSSFVNGFAMFFLCVVYS